MADRRKWAFSLDTRRKRDEGSSETKTFPKPLGFDMSKTEQMSASGKKTDPQRTRELKKKKAWELAYSPGKGILMTAFMVWVTGSSVNIVNIMIALFALINPVKSIAGTRAAFARFDDLGMEAILPQMLFILLHLVNMAIGLYKSYSLGLLPTDADWATRLPVRETFEFSGGGWGF